jgi:hypothetical protein
LDVTCAVCSTRVLWGGECVISEAEGRGNSGGGGVRQRIQQKQNIPTRKHKHKRTHIGNDNNGNKDTTTTIQAYLYIHNTDLQDKRQTLSPRLCIGSYLLGRTSPCKSIYRRVSIYLYQICLFIYTVLFSSVINNQKQDLCIV